jgi:hypothetical protein
MATPPSAIVTNAAATSTATSSGTALASITRAPGTLVSAGLSDKLNATDEFNATVTRFAFPTEWEADRQEAIRILELLPQITRDAEHGLRLIEEIRRSSADRQGIGGNRPPDEIEDAPTDEIITDIEVARDALLTELTSDQPHLSSIRLAARTLKRAIGWLGRKLAWLAAIMAGGFAGGVAKKLGEDNAEPILQHISNLESNINAVITPVGHLFTSLHLPL